MGATMLRGGMVSRVACTPKGVFVMTATAYSNFNFIEDGFITHIDDNVATEKTATKPNEGKQNRPVTYLKTVKSNIGFREAAGLVRVAESNGSIVRLVVGRATGNTKSIMSIIKMGIKPDTLVAISVMNGNTDSTLADCVKILEGA